MKPRQVAQKLLYKPSVLDLELGFCHEAPRFGMLAKHIGDANLVVYPPETDRVVEAIESDFAKVDRRANDFVSLGIRYPQIEALGAVAMEQVEHINNIRPVPIPASPRSSEDALSEFTPQVSLAF